MTESDELLERQRVYYDERAPDFLDPTKPSDRRIPGELPKGLCDALIDEFAPTGDVLELAAGTGSCTKEIVRHATSVTALDGSPRMIERNRHAVGDEKVRYVVADLFDWVPNRMYDAVVFQFWLSHVPPGRFDYFWQLVRRCLAPGGRVCFIDEDDRGAENDEITVVDGVPMARRTLSDGREFQIVKVFWDPAELERRVRSLGWEVSVRRVGDTFLFGIGFPTPV